MTTHYEGKVAFFYPEDSRFRHIYSDAPLYSVEVTADFSNCFAAWGSVGYVSAHGSSIGLDTSTTINLLPIALGLKCFYKVRDADRYAGLGGQFTRLHIRDHSEDVIQRLSHWGWGWGGIAKLGCLYNLRSNVFF